MFDVWFPSSWTLFCFDLKVCKSYLSCFVRIESRKVRTPHQMKGSVFICPWIFIYTTLTNLPHYSQQNQDWRRECLCCVCVTVCVCLCISLDSYLTQSWYDGNSDYLLLLQVFGSLELFFISQKQLTRTKTTR